MKMYLRKISIQEYGRSPLPRFGGSMNAFRPEEPFAVHPAYRRRTERRARRSSEHSERPEQLARAMIRLMKPANLKSPLTA